MPRQKEKKTKDKKKKGKKKKKTYLNMLMSEQFCILAMSFV